MTTLEYSRISDMESRRNHTFGTGDNGGSVI